MSDEPHSRVITTPSGDRQFQAIVHWKHEFGSAHCLARVRLSDAPLAIVSEVRSNPDERAIALEFPRVADAVLTALPSKLVAPEAVMWIAHYGEFSSYDAHAAPEDFYQVELRWDGSRHHGDLEGHHIFDTDEVVRVLADVDLMPVPEVLRDLNWTY